MKDLDAERRREASCGGLHHTLRSSGMRRGDRELYMPRTPDKPFLAAAGLQYGYAFRAGLLHEQHVHG